MPIKSLLPQRYASFRRVGVSELAEVYLARQVTPSGAARQVVLKRFSRRLTEEGRGGAFVEDLLAAAGLCHANLSPIFDVGDDNGHFCVVSGAWRGLTLHALVDGLTRVGRMVPMAMSLNILLQVLEALRYAHDFSDDSGRQRTMVHRALSPHNIAISTEGMVSVLDFGAAWPERFLRDPHVRRQLRYAYAAPECLRGEVPDGRADLFSIGVLLYELSVGQRLFAAEPPATLDLSDRQVPPPTYARAGYPVDLEGIVMAALEYEASERVASAEEMVLRLEQFTEDTGLRASSLRLGQLVTEVLGISTENPLEVDDNAEVETGLLGAEDLDFDRDALFVTDEDAELSLPTAVRPGRQQQPVTPSDVEVEPIADGVEVSSVELLVRPRRTSTVVVTEELVEEEIDLDGSNPEILLDVGLVADARRLRAEGDGSGQEREEAEKPPDRQRKEHTSAALRVALDDLERALSAAEVTEAEAEEAEAEEAEAEEAEAEEAEAEEAEAEEAEVGDSEAEEVEVDDVDVDVDVDVDEKEGEAGEADPEDAEEEEGELDAPTLELDGPTVADPADRADGGAANEPR